MIASLLLGEAAIGLLEGTLSADVRHIIDAPARVHALGDAPAPRVLLVGNSMLRCALAPDLAARLAAARGEPCAAATVVMDGSDVLQWRWALERLLVDARARPDAVVLGFTPGQLGDANPVPTQRLARHVRFGDVAALAAEEALSIEQTTHLVLARASALVRNADRVRTRCLDAVVPAYRRVRPRLAAQGAPTAMRGGDRRLRRLLALLAREGVVVFAVAMPTRADYDVPAAARDGLEGATILDGRRPPDLVPGEAHFEDDVHLSPAGAEVFTEWLARELAARLDRR
ncbi:MAG: hypothetical protein M9894_27460 [Planctomycetes bacterium]|nr:hypothetical protein [Planctomycetota bacterium]